MIRTKLFLACALAFVVSLAGTPATAQEPVNQLTYFTFSAPFELPGGKVLPAGKYVFKIVDSPSNRHVIHIMSEDQQQMHATVMAIPAQRMEPSEEPEVRFMEAEANMPPAIRTWWYPGRVIGHEFIYPKDHARRLAARQTEGVLTADATTEDEMRTADLSRIDAQGRETAWNAEATAERQTATAQTETQTQPMTTPQTAQTAQTTPTEPTTAQTPAQTTTAQTTTPQTTDRTMDRTAQPTADTTRTAMDTTRTELPRTASPLPLIGLLGLASLMGAGLLRFRR